MTQQAAAPVLQIAARDQLQAQALSGPRQVSESCLMFEVAASLDAQKQMAGQYYFLSVAVLLYIAIACLCAELAIR